MNGSPVYLPPDAFERGTAFDRDLAADYLELSAFFAGNSQVHVQIIKDALEIGAEEDYRDIDSEIRHREEVEAVAVECMVEREHALGTAYPFRVDETGDVVTVKDNGPTLGQAAYLVSLILSNLNAVSPLLNEPQVHPAKNEIRKLREFFQYFATAAVAAEIGGPAWSFGFPRPGKTGFMTKLTEIWREFRDGTPGADPSAPTHPKDDQIDVFARRMGNDKLPGFLFVAAQVATGANWRQKSLTSHVQKAFQSRWFQPRQPVTPFIPYHVIPFARLELNFRDDVLTLGCNVLHRLRVPRRVEEAIDLVQKDVAIEAFDELPAAIRWVEEYARRVSAT